jgi:hypothetical protein
VAIREWTYPKGESKPQRMSRWALFLVMMLTASSASAQTEEPAPTTKDWRFGGTLGVVTLPRPLTLELFARFKERVDFGVGVEYLPPGLVNFGKDTTLSWLQVDAMGRYFFYKMFYGGLRAGYQFSRSDSMKFGSEVDYVTSGLFVSPHVGLLFTLKNGLLLGGDLGVTIPLFPNDVLYSDGTTDSNARKASKTFGMFVIPFISAFRIGYRF